MNHSRWKTTRMRETAEGYVPSPEEQADRAAIRLSMAFAPVPTVPLLWRLAQALDGALSIELDGDTNTVRFAAHRLAV